LGGALESNIKLWAKKSRAKKNEQRTKLFAKKGVLVQKPFQKVPEDERRGIKDLKTKDEGAIHMD